MRQLVVVDWAQGLPPERLIGAVLAAEPLRTPITSLSEPADPPPVKTAIAPRKRTWSDDLDFKEYFVGDERRPMVIVDHSDGYFASVVSERALQVLRACDTTIALCPAWATRSAVKFYERALFAMGGVYDKAAVRASTSLLLSVVNHLAAEGQRRRLNEPMAMAEAASVDDAEIERVTLSNVEARSSWPEESLFEASGAQFVGLAEQIGFTFARDVTVEAEGAMMVRSGPAGIASFGPYAMLDEGRYCFWVDASADAPIAMTLEAVCDQGAVVLAHHAFSFPEEARAVTARLEFDVTAAQSLQPLELRLWRHEGAPGFRITRFKLIGST